MDKYNEAQRLIDANFNAPFFDTHIAERAGQKRAEARLEKKQNENKKIPISQNLSRQVRRRLLLLSKKAAKSQAKAKERAEKRNRNRAKGSLPVSPGEDGPVYTKVG